MKCAFGKKKRGLLLLKCRHYSSCKKWIQREIRRKGRGGAELEERVRLKSSSKERQQRERERERMDKNALKLLYLMHLSLLTVKMLQFRLSPKRKALSSEVAINDFNMKMNYLKRSFMLWIHCNSIIFCWVIDTF